MPADLTGTEIYRPQDGTFVFRQGPLFHNLVLADEVNRAPAKVQSALLEAMGERQITVGSVTYPLPALFMVMATQNPIEQEGTYPLPEAQLDRFLLHVLVTYPDAAGERAILELNRAEQKRSATDEALFTAPEVLTQKEVLAARLQVLDQHLSEPLQEYIVQIVLATRSPERYGDDLDRRAAVRREPARDDRARSLRPRACVARGPRLRDARGRARHGARRAAPSHPARLRS